MKWMFGRQLIVSVSLVVFASAKVVQWPPAGGVQLSAFAPGTEGILRGADSVEVLGKWSNQSGLPLSLWTVDSRIMRENLFSIMAMNPGSVAGYFSGPPLHSAWKGGFLHNLAPIWEREGWLTDISSGLRNTCGMPGDDSGDLFCVPFETYIWAMFYRESVWDGMGLPAKKPETFDEMLEVCEDVKVRHNKPCIALGTEHVWYVGAWIDYLSMRMYGPAFHQNFTSGQADFQGPECRAIFAQFQQMFIKGYFNTDSRDRFWDEAADLFLNGETAMMLIADWFKGNLISGHWESLKDENWLDVYKDINFFRFPKIADVPIGEDMPTDALMMGFAETQEAADNGESLLAYLMGDDYQMAIMNMIQVPARVSIQQKKNLDLEQAGHMFQKMMKFIDESDVVLQFFDRDLNREMVAIGWEGFRILLADPLNPDSLEQMLALMEAGRKEIYVGQVTDPVIYPESGTYEAPLNVTADCLAKGVVIRYSRDAAIWPQESSPEIPAEGVMLGFGEHVFRIFAGKKGVKPSMVVEARYTVTDSSRVEPCDIGWFRGEVGGDCQACAAGTASPSMGATECVACAMGEFNSGEGRSACDKCPKGTYGPSAQATEVGACLPCVAGKYLNSTGAIQISQCMECGAGKSTTSFRGQALCVECSTGTFASGGNEECDFCPKATYAQSLGTIKCMDCAAGLTTLNIASMNPVDCLCNEGSYMDDGACHDCPVGMKCPVGSNRDNYPTATADFGLAGNPDAPYPILQPLHWSSEAEPFSVFICQSDERCPGGAPGMCPKGSRKMVCGFCEDGYVWDSDEGCSECSSVETSKFLFPILPFLLAPIIVLGMYKLFGDTYENWGTWKNGCASIGFILLNHYQIIAMLSDCNMAYPESVAGMYGAFAFTTDASTIFHPDCAGFGDFKANLITKTIAPAFILMIFVAVWGISQLLASQGLAMEKNRTFNSAMSLMFTFFAGICEMALLLFKCSPNPNGTATLAADRTVICNEADWNEMIAVGCVAVVLWVFGIGGAFVWAVWAVPKQFSDANIQMRWKFLFLKYRSDVHWWALVFVAKGFMLNFGFCMLDLGIEQIYWVMTILLAYTVAVVTFRPWRQVAVNAVDIWVHFSLIMVCSLMTWFARDGVEENLERLDRDLAGLLIFFGVLCLPVIPPAVGYMFWQQATSGGITAKDKQCKNFITAVTTVRPMIAEDADFKKIMNELAEWDFWIVNEASKVMLSEISTHKKVKSGLSTKEHQEKDVTVAAADQKAGWQSLQC